MRAMVLRAGVLAIEDVPRPEPGPGQVLARVVAAGVCGSDLHVYAAGPRPDGLPLVMGHEFVADVVLPGPGVARWLPGTRVTCMPLLLREDAPGGAVTVGLTPGVAGAYGEYLLLSADLLLEIPAGVDPRTAATTEPCAVGLHAVRLGNVAPGEAVLVMGAGPIGLMVLLWLRRDASARRVVVTDPAPERRAMAVSLGADVALDPRDPGFTTALREALGGELPPPPRTRSFAPPPALPAPDVVFECVGAPGTIQQAMALAQAGGRVTVVGACPGEDRFVPMTGIAKQLTVRFALGYDQDEFAAALGAIADGSVDPSPMVTRAVDLDALPDAFRALADPADCKVVWQPAG